MKKKSILKLAGVIAGALLLAFMRNSCGSSNKNEKTMKEFDEFIKKFEAKYIPLYKDASIASWTADLTGKPEDSKKSADLTFKMSKMFADKNDFDLIKKDQGIGRYHRFNKSKRTCNIIQRFPRRANGYGENEKDN